MHYIWSVALTLCYFLGLSAILLEVGSSWSVPHGFTAVSHADPSAVKL